MKRNLPRTEEIIPRNYGLAFASHDRNHVIFPTMYVLGQAMRMKEKELDEYLQEWLRLKKKSPKHPIHAKKDLTESSFDDLKELLLRKIQANEGANNLYVVGGDETIESPVYYPNGFLKGKVKRKGDGREGGAYARVTLQNPFLASNGFLNYGELDCTCPEQDWESVKRYTTVCTHLAAMETQNFLDCNKSNDLERVISYRERKPHDPIMPFSFVDNPDANIRTLFMDVLISYYILGRGQFTLNKRLLALPEIYRAAPLEMIRKGEASFVVIRQQNARREMPSYKIKHIRELVGSLKQQLYEKGFEREGFDLEFRGTSHEAIGERYAKGNMAVSVVASPHYLPIVVAKVLQPNEVRLFDKQETVESHPLARVNQRYSSIDDFSRRVSQTRVIMPGISQDHKFKFRLRPWMEREYRKTYETMRR